MDKFAKINAKLETTTHAQDIDDQEFDADDIEDLDGDEPQEENTTSTTVLTEKQPEETKKETLEEVAASLESFFIDGVNALINAPVTLQTKSVQENTSDVEEVLQANKSNGIESLLNKATSFAEQAEIKAAFKDLDDIDEEEDEEDSQIVHEPVKGNLVLNVPSNPSEQVEEVKQEADESLEITSIESTDKQDSNPNIQMSTIIPQEIIERHKIAKEELAKGSPSNPNWEFINGRSKELGMTPQEYYEKCWLQDTRHNDDTWKKEKEEAEKNFVSKYQCTDPTEKTGLYLEFDKEEFKKEHCIPENVSVFVIESYYDYVYEKLQKEKRELEHTLNAQARYDARLEKETAAAVKRVHKLHNKKEKEKEVELIKRGVEAGDKRSIRKEEAEKVEAALQGIKEDFDPDEEEPKTELYFWDAGIKVLNNVFGNQLEIIYSGGGRFGGIEFGFKSKFPHTKGINNTDLYYYQTMTHIDRKLMMALSGVKGEARQFWFALFNGSPNQARISKFAPFLDDTELQKFKTHSITGKKLAWKCIPPLETFDPEVQKINPHDLLSLLPAAEADSFLIHIGRIAYGMNRETVVDGVKYRVNQVLESPEDIHYRWSMVLHGDANIGKSKLIEYLCNAFRIAGYSSRALGTTFNQFGWKHFADKDICFVDDSVDKKILQMLMSDKMKTAISNGVQDFETKGRDGEENVSRAALIIAANRLCFPQKFDVGVSNRFHFLQIHSRHQMQQKSQQRGRNMFPVSFWLDECERLNVSMECLGLYLIRRGLDRYLEVAGVVQQPDGTYKRDKEKVPSRTGIEDQLEKNREKYVFSPPIEDKEYISALCRRAFAVSAFLEPSYASKENMSHEYDTSMHAFTLINTAGTITKLQFEIDECGVNERNILKYGGTPERLDWEKEKASTYKKILQWIDPKNIIPIGVWAQLRTYWQGKSNNGQNLGNSKKFTFEEIWKELSALITTFDGRPIEATRYEWTPAFEAARANLDGYMSELQELIQEFYSKLSPEEIKSFKRVATRFVFPTTKITANEAHYEDVQDV